MSDFQFPCPSCGQQIQCDESLGGQKITCPICNNALIAPTPGGGKKLAVAAQSSPHSQPKFAPADFRPAKKKSIWPRVINAVATIAVLGLVTFVVIKTGLYDKAKGYFIKDKSDAAASTIPATNGTTEMASGTPSGTPAPAPAPAPAAPPPTPAVWTLDLASSVTPSAPVKGEVTGTSFTLDSATLAPNPTGGTLELRQGTNAIPDKQILVYLKVKPGEKLEGRTFEITSDKKTGVPTILKKWKTDPRYAAQQKVYGGGYAMKLEFGNTNKDGAISGKIFLALPDPEKSFVAGTFSSAKASTAPVYNNVDVQGEMDPKMKAR